MAEPDFTIGEDDTGPSLEETLLGPDGNPIDLTGATVAFIMQIRDRSVPATSTAADIVDPIAALVSVDFTVETANAGNFTYQWRITLSGGQVVTVPNDRYRTMRVQKKLA